MSLAPMRDVARSLTALSRMILLTHAIHKYISRLGRTCQLMGRRI